jgi:hypothetical protein
MVIFQIGVPIIMKVSLCIDIFNEVLSLIVVIINIDSWSVPNNSLSKYCHVKF